MSLFGRWGHRTSPSAGEEEPRASGPAREVADLVPVEGRWTPTDALAYPVAGAGAGQLIHAVTEGPVQVRPGDLDDAVAHPLRNIAEMTILRQGALEHRDSLGHRGTLTAPAVRLVSGGAGVVTEIGPSPALQRDGGAFDAITLRWLQPGPPSIPTVRIAQDVPSRRQGRTEVTRWAGTEGAVGDPTGVEVVHVSVPAGGTVDLEVADGGAVSVVVRAGTALIGDGLTAVTGPGLAVMGEEGTRLTIATRLDGDAGADLIIVHTSRVDPPMVHRDAMLAGHDEEDLAAALEASRNDGFGTLPRD